MYLSDNRGFICGCQILVLTHKQLDSTEDDAVVLGQRVPPPETNERVRLLMVHIPGASHI